MQSKEEYEKSSIPKFMDEIKNHGYLYQTIVEALHKAYEEGFNDCYATAKMITIVRK